MVDFIFNFIGTGLELIFITYYLQRRYCIKNYFYGIICISLLIATFNDYYNLYFHIVFMFLLIFTNTYIALDRKKSVIDNNLILIGNNIALILLELCFLFATEFDRKKTYIIIGFIILFYGLSIKYEKNYIKIINSGVTKKVLLLVMIVVLLYISKILFIWR